MAKMIYCQRDIPKDKWRYGFRSSAATGCGWIATYNALALLGCEVKPEKLIHYFEWQLPLIHGNTGTSFWGPAVFFKSQGYPVKMSARLSSFNQIVEDSDACILLFWWKRKWALGAHFVALHKTDRGIVGYNTYRNSKREDFYGTSLQEFIKKRKYFGTFLIGIKNK